MATELRFAPGVLLLAGLAACAVPAARSDRGAARAAQAPVSSGITCELRAPGTKRLLEPVVPVTFALRNDGVSNIRVLKRQTPLEGILGDLFDVRLEGQQLEFRGPMVKRGPPTESEFLQLAPGEHAKATVDLLEGYDVTLPGRYTVRFVRTDEFACNELVIERN